MKTLELEWTEQLSETSPWIPIPSKVMVYLGHFVVKDMVYIIWYRYWDHITSPWVLLDGLGMSNLPAGRTDLSLFPSQLAREPCSKRKRERFVSSTGTLNSSWAETSGSWQNCTCGNPKCLPDNTYEACNGKMDGLERLHNVPWSSWLSSSKHSWKHQEPHVQVTMEWYGHTTQLHKYVSRIWRQEVFIDASVSHATPIPWPTRYTGFGGSVHPHWLQLRPPATSKDWRLEAWHHTGSSGVTLHISILLWTGHPVTQAKFLKSHAKGQAATRNVLRRVGQMKSRKTFGEDSTLGTSTLHQTSNRKGLWMRLLQTFHNESFDSWSKEMFWTYLDVKNKLWNCDCLGGTSSYSKALKQTTTPPSIVKTCDNMWVTCM